MGELGKPDLGLTGTAVARLDRDGRLRPYSSLDEWVHYSNETGTRIASDQVSIDFISDKPYALWLRPEFDVITLKLGPTVGTKAWNTDRVTPMNVTAGKAYLFPAGSTIYSHATATSSFPMLELSKSFREDVVAEFGQRSAPAFDRIYEEVPSDAFLPLAQSIRAIMLGGNHGGALAADAIAVLVLTEVMRALTKWDAQDAIGGLDENRLALALSYIEEHLSSDISTSDLAALTGLSVFHFTRSFKSATGVSPHQYVLERRLARARILLESSANGLASIAYDVGFSSQAHMTTVFKKRLGTTPGRYRRERLN